MERTYFFDSTEEDQRIYNAADFARFHAQIIGNGVSNTANLPDLEVTAQSNMNVGLGAGYMFANGYMYENTSTLTLTHDTADSNNDRIDRVVIRFDNDPEERTIKAMILKGVPANNPVPPTLRRDNYVHQMSVAQVRIIKGKSFIEQSQITDERANDAVCGYIPLHNIYRGLEINELGMVTMPNQSYIEMSDSVSLTIGGDASETYVYTDIPLRAEIDLQDEITNNTFIAKADGVFTFNFHITFNSSVAAAAKIEAALVKNGQSQPNNLIYVLNRPGTGAGDLNFFGTATTALKKGDEIKIIVGSLRLGGSRASTRRRLTITKTS